ncbi:MAG: trigger factor [Candidatus Dormibacteria bacterium]
MTAVPQSPDITVESEAKPNSQVALRVEAPASELDRAVHGALRRIARQVRVPGFRPGKAPAAVIERMVGWDVVRQEATEQLVPELYLRAVQQADLDPVGDPDLDLGELERGKPVSFTATVTVRPKVDLGDYTAVRVTEEHTDIGEKEIDETIEEVRRRAAKLTPVERPAQAGDVLQCSLRMRRGEETFFGSEEQRELELDRDKLLPGLLDGILGLAAGAERSFNITLPDDYGREDLRGVEVEVDVAVSAVQERELPPVDDDLAKADGNTETVATMREHYRERLVRVAQDTDDERYEEQVLTALRERVDVEIPELMVEQQIDRQLAELESRISRMGLGFEQYVQLSGSSVEQLREEARDGARQRVRLDLALDALATAEGLEVDESQVEREEQRLIGDAKLTADQRRRLHALTHRDLRRRAAVARMQEIARGEV